MPRVTDSAIREAIARRQHWLEYLKKSDASIGSSIHGLLSEYSQAIVSAVGAGTHPAGTAVRTTGELNRIGAEMDKQLRSMLSSADGVYKNNFTVLSNGLNDNTLGAYFSYGEPTVDRLRASFGAFQRRRVPGLFQSGRDNWMQELSGVGNGLKNRMRGHLTMGRLEGMGQRQVAQRIASDPAFSFQNLPGDPAKMEELFTRGGSLGTNEALRERANRIVRDANSETANRMHEGWTQEAFGEDALYVNINPLDGRTTKGCAEASRLAAMPLPKWDQQIFSDGQAGRPPRKFQCRSTLHLWPHDNPAAAPPVEPPPERPKPTPVPVTPPKPRTLPKLPRARNVSQAKKQAESFIGGTGVKHSGITPQGVEYIKDANIDAVNAVNQTLTKLIDEQGLPRLSHVKYGRIKGQGTNTWGLSRTKYPHTLPADKLYNTLEVKAGDVQRMGLKEFTATRATNHKAYLKRVKTERANVPANREVIARAEREIAKGNSRIPIRKEKPVKLAPELEATLSPAAREVMDMKKADYKDGYLWRKFRSPERAEMFVEQLKKKIANPVAPSAHADDLLIAAGKADHVSAVTMHEYGHALHFKVSVDKAGYRGGRKLGGLYGGKELGVGESMQFQTIAEGTEAFKVASVVSEYAKSDYAELFAECFTLYMGSERKRLPASMIKIIGEAIEIGKDIRIRQDAGG